MKNIILTIALLFGFTLVGMAQQQEETMYLIKENKVIGEYSVNDVDYISFYVPEGVEKLKSVDISIEETGKNYLKYQVKTTKPNTEYMHMVINLAMFDMVITEMYGTSYAESTPETIKECITLCLYSGFGQYGQGTQTFNYKDGDEDEYGNKFEVLGGQDFLLAVCDMPSPIALGEDISYITEKTLTPGEAEGSVSVTYDGLNSNGEAIFSFEYTPDIIRIYTMYGLKSVLEEYIANKGLEYTVALFGESWLPEEINENTYGWPVEEENDYVMYAIGIDEYGDWAKASITQHITPAMETNQPVISILSKEKGQGQVVVNFEIKPSNVSEAYINLVNQNTVDNQLNEGKTLAEIAETNGTNITTTINQQGEYGYTNSNVPEGWQTLLISGKNEDGTSVTRMDFNAHVENSDWDITTDNGQSQQYAAKKSDRKTVTMSNFKKSLADKLKIKKQ